MRLETGLRTRGIPFQPCSGRTPIWDYEYIGSLRRLIDLKEIRRWEAGPRGNKNQEAFIHFQENELRSKRLTQVKLILDAIEAEIDDEIPAILAQCDAKINEKGEMYDVPDGRLEKNLLRYPDASENDCYIFMPEDMKKVLNQTKQISKFRRTGTLSVAKMFSSKKRHPLKLDTFIKRRLDANSR